MTKSLFVLYSHSASQESLRRINEAARMSGFEVTNPESDRDVVGDITSAIYSSIINADVILAVLDRASPNLLFELGYAMGAGKNVLVVADANVAVPSDVATVPYVRLHDDKPRDLETLNRALSQFKVSPRLGAAGLTPRQQLSEASANAAVLAAITPSKFEELVGSVLRETGFEVTRASGELASRCDFVISAPGQSSAIVVEVKKYAPQSRLSIEHVYRLAEAAQLVSAVAGILISSAAFTASAVEFAARSMPRLALLSVEQFVTMKHTNDVLAATGRLN